MDPNSAAAASSSSLRFLKGRADVWIKRYSSVVLAFAAVVDLAFRWDERKDRKLEARLTELAYERHQLKDQTLSLPQRLLVEFNKLRLNQQTSLPLFLSFRWPKPKQVVAEEMSLEQVKKVLQSLFNEKNRVVATTPEEKVRLMLEKEVLRRLVGMFGKEDEDVKVEDLTIRDKRIIEGMLQQSNDEQKEFLKAVLSCC